MNRIVLGFGLGAGLAGWLALHVIAGKTAEERRLRDRIANHQACVQAVDTARWRIAEACPAPVQRLHAEGLTLRTERDQVRAELAEVLAARAAAIARAEARALDTEQRKTRAETRLDRQPESGAGLRRCDAECLRGLGG